MEASISYSIHARWRLNAAAGRRRRPKQEHHSTFLACIWPGSGVEAGKTEYLCLLFHTGRAARDGDPLCGISLPSSWIVPFTGQRGRDERRRTHSSFRFYGSRCLQPHFSWHVTKCNVHTAAGPAFSSWSPSFTHKLLSLPRFQPQTCLVLTFTRSLPASTSSRLRSMAVPFLLCIFVLQQCCLFARGGADRRCLAASRPGPPCVCSDVQLVLSAIGLCLFWADNGLLPQNQCLIDTLEEKGEFLSSGQQTWWLSTRGWEDLS